MIGPWLLLLAAEPDCFRLVGDVGLSRGVAVELDRRGSAPWSTWSDPRRPLIGNLEGTVIPAEGHCQKSPALCLGFSADRLQALAGGPFLAFSVANNHAGDYGPPGRSATQLALSAAGLGAIGPTGWATRVGGQDLVFFAVDLVGADRPERQRSLEALRLAILRASAEATVVVLPHFGVEGDGEPSADQRAWADRWVAWGATLVAGAHAHRPQGGRCGEDHGIWYGLGNFVFDQPEGSGWVVECCPSPGQLRCAVTAVAPAPGSSFPQVVAPVPEAQCQLRTPKFDLNFRRHPQAQSLVTVEPMGEGLWFGLRRRHSTFDGEEALRPYVFRIEDHRVIDVWRGTSLSWPLVAARWVKVDGEPILCALHRDDSFLHPRPETLGRRWAAYSFNGFGFTRREDPKRVGRCQGL
ncbi:MAG: CapA family protein [Deltaproteobacteria bacterium]|nr:CapA family protein [Deltaproteobacteria bacterium]